MVAGITFISMVNCATVPFWSTFGGGRGKCWDPSLFSKLEQQSGWRGERIKLGRLSRVMDVFSHTCCLMFRIFLPSILHFYLDFANVLHISNRNVVILKYLVIVSFYINCIVISLFAHVHMGLRNDAQWTTPELCWCWLYSYCLICSPCASHLYCIWN